MNGPVLVLLAAGEGRRYGGLKQLAPIGGEPMLRHVVHGLSPGGLPLLVVLGAGAAEVGATIADLPIQVVRHAGWQEGLGSSLAAGVRAATAACPGASGVLVCLADQPHVDATLLAPLLARHREDPTRILATDHAGRPGPPVLFPADCVPALLACHGDRGAQALLARESARVERVLFAVQDVDTPDDLARLDAARSSARQPRTL